MASSSSIRDSLHHDGFVLIPSLLPPASLIRLRAVSEAAALLARSGAWPHIRTLPKQFPPWTSDVNSGIWGVQHLMHPALPPNISEAFIQSYFCDEIIGIVKELLADDGDAEVQDKDLVMELYNLLVRPDRDFELRWHRDDVPPEATEEEERRRLDQKAWHAQWNAALYDDCSLVVVPGSHARPRTQEERSADPFAKAIDGMKVVEMKAGDVVFYDNNILHRGVYDAKRERMTLHGSVGHVKGNKERARNVLQHGVGSWVGEMRLNGLNEKERLRAEGMRARLVEMGKTSGEVGYSQPE